MPDYSSHDYVMKELAKSQDADQDNRERAREAHDFIDRRDGQWEDNVLNGAAGKPRYTFDLTTPLINQVAGKLAKADFAGDIKPMGGDATKEIAETLDGIVRNIQVISNATDTYNSSSRGMITCGIDGWQIVQKFVDGDSFDQDLIIENVENFVDRVWFDVGAERQDKADAKFGWKFTAFTPDAYKAKWPEAKARSMPEDRQRNSYFNKPEMIMVAEFYYIEEVERELVLMSNNAVYEDNEDFKKVKKELADLGVTEVRRRKRKKNVVYERKMDGDGWLGESKETVFDYIPLIPTYGNYKISDNKTLYHGLVEKRLDPQRVFNYTMSRQIEEGSLAPRAKYWMTTKQVGSHSATLQTMNTNADPVQIYDHDSEVPGPPQQNGGAQVNPGLQMISQAVGALIPESAGLFAANMGDNPNAQSGVAINSLKDQGDVGTITYFASQEVAICHTMRILVKAIPKVYVGERQVRILKEDGSFEMIKLNESVTDNETQEEVVLNNLALGSYDASCSAGPSFQNRQQETVAAMVEIGGVNPAVVQIGSDILLKNVTAPGMSLLADRERARLFKDGLIPQDQWTDEEKEQMAAMQQQPQQPDALMVAAQAEQAKADAAMVKAQNDQSKIMLQAQKQDLERQKAEFDAMMEQNKAQLAPVQALVEMLNKNAHTFKLLREGSGADAVITPEIMEALQEQAVIVGENQETL